MIRALVRLSFRSTTEAVKLALAVGERVLQSAEQVLGRDRRSEPDAERHAAAPERPPAPRAPEPPAPRAPEPPAPEPSAPDVPEHVETPVELVAERADPGAGDGAGAQLHVQEPWDGYARLNASDIIDRLSTADAPTLAVVELYETTHKRRQTVLAALRKRRRAPSGGRASKPQED